MEITATLNQLRISPRKVRLVANVIRGLSVDAAEAQLRHINKRSATPLLKLLNSAIANAEHNQHINRDQLMVASIQVNAGLTLKRWQPKAMGRATILRKRASRIKLALKQKVQPVKKANKNSQPVKTQTKTEAITQ